MKIVLSETQLFDLFEGVNVNTGVSPINFSINTDKTDYGNRHYADTRFFGTRGDVAYGDGTYKRNGYDGVEDEYKSTLANITLYKTAIRIVQHGWYKNINRLFANINSPQNVKTTVLRRLMDKTMSNEEKISNFTDRLNAFYNKLNVIQGKYDRINSIIKTGRVGRPKRISNDTVIPRYNVGIVPNTNVKLIALFEISDFNFSDAIKHGSMRSNEKKGIGNGETINKIGRGRQKARVNIEYDNGITPNVANNFSLNNVNAGHFKQQYGYNDENYTSVAQFMDKSIMAAAYAIRKENVQIDYILDAPSSSNFNHYYCTNLSNKLGVEYRTGFFQRNMLNVSLDDEKMRKDGVNETIINNSKQIVSKAAISEVTSYMTDCVEKFVDENYAYLNGISLERLSRMKVDRNLLIDFIREQSYYGLLSIKQKNPKTTNLYMYLVNHFADYKKSIKSTVFNTEHISNEISKILRTRLSKKYQLLLSEIDNITTKYENILLTNGMALSSCKKFKATDIDERVRPYLRNAYVVADKEMAYNKNGILDKLRESLQNKHFLIVDEDMDSGATLQLLISALKDKELECSTIDRKPGRPKKNYITDDKITCLVNAIKK